MKRRTKSIIKPENTPNKKIEKPQQRRKIKKNCGQLVDFKSSVWSTAMDLS